MNLGRFQKDNWALDEARCFIGGADQRINSAAKSWELLRRTPMYQSFYNGPPPNLGSKTEFDLDAPLIMTTKGLQLAETLDRFSHASISLDVNDLPALQRIIQPFEDFLGSWRGPWCWSVNILTSRLTARRIVRGT